MNTDRTIYVEHLSGGDWEWLINVSDIELPDAELLGLELINITSEKRCFCPVISAQRVADCETILKVDLSPLKDTIENCKTERWKTHLVVNINDNAEENRIYHLSDPSYERSEEEKRIKKDMFKRRLEYVREPIGHIKYGDRVVEAVPDSVSKGEWVICMGDRCLRYMYALRCVAEDARVKKDKLYFKVHCPDIEGFTWKGIVLSYRYYLEKDRTDIFFPFKTISSGNDHLTAVAECTAKEMESRTVYWDVRVVFEKEGEQFWTLLKSARGTGAAAKSAAAGKITGNLFKRQTLDIGIDYQMTIGETNLGNTTIVIQERSPYNGFLFRIKERFAMLIYIMLRKYLANKKIFLVHEKFCTSAQENGLAFFKYCMQNDVESQMKRHIYYVIDKKSKDYSNVEMYKDHVIQFMSIKHMVYILAARLIISSDSKLHSYAWRAYESIIRPRVLEKKKLVFLQHGVIGIKRVPMFKKGMAEGCSLFITSNEREKGFVVKNLGYSPDQVVITGLARWDNLTDKSTETGQNRILLMPTWRNWLNEATDNVFLESEYFKRYMELINSTELQKLLDRCDLYLDFFIHPKLRDQLSKFSTSNKRIRMIPFGAEPLNELMMQCKLLITDYSSVCWDVYYQGKPVLFYQFDLAKYNEAQGAYMDLKKELFGDRAETLEELLELLNEAADSSFELKPQYAEMRKNMYGYMDHSNSKRICEEIRKRGW